MTSQAPTAERLPVQAAMVAPTALPVAPAIDPPCPVPIAVANSAVTNSAVANSPSSKTPTGTFGLFSSPHSLWRSRSVGHLLAPSAREIRKKIKRREAPNFDNELDFWNHGWEVMRARITSNCFSVFYAKSGFSSLPYHKFTLTWQDDALFVRNGSSPQCCATGCLLKNTPRSTEGGRILLYVFSSRHPHLAEG